MFAITTAVTVVKRNLLLVLADMPLTATLLRLYTS
jgi:hypothetical protein